MADALKVRASFGWPRAGRARLGVRSGSGRLSTAGAPQAEGNAAFTAKDFPKAIDCFTKAIELDASNHVLFSNRSAAKVGPHGRASGHARPGSRPAPRAGGRTQCGGPGAHIEAGVAVMCPGCIAEHASCPSRQCIAPPPPPWHAQASLEDYAGALEDAEKVMLTA
jgi:hypothetical protein